MPSNADMRAPHLGQSGSSRVVTGDVGRNHPPSARTRTVLIYLVIALLSLAPGFVLRFAPEIADVAGSPLHPLGRALDDIRFGSGLRFWLGVSGALLLAILLIYPLRKMLSPRIRLGSVGAWFHAHLVIGLAGPVLILYHCNFGQGSRNANVALWSMLAVVLSGIIGHFVYQSASAEFYSGKQKAREQLLAIASALGPLTALRAERETIMDDLDSLDRDLLTPRRGILASLGERWNVESRRLHFGRTLSHHIADCAALLELPRAEHDRLRSVVGAHLNAYFRYARQASSRSVREQVWATWRLFHLPVFLLMTAAAGLHIAAVWDLPPPGAFVQVQGEPAHPVARAAAPSQPVRTRPAGPDVRKVTSITVTPLSTEAPPGPAAPSPGPPAPIDPTEPPHTRAAPPPRIAQRHPDADKPVQPPTATRRAPVPPQPIATKPQDLPAPPPAPTAPEISDLKRLEEQRMSLGGAKPADLTAQIAALKEKRRLQQFFHSEIETGFPLTGKHSRLDCTACHSKPLRESRQSDVRTCLDCHRKDDIHRGKRPDCAQCHTTARWSQLLKRR